MIAIQPARDRFDELVQFVAHLNSDGAHHIGFFGEGEAEVRLALAECLIPPDEGFRLAYEEDRLVGVLGIDADPEISRAWHFGPIVNHEDWQEIADLLYAEVVILIPAGIRDYDLFCDERNTNLEGFALRHGFPLRSENAVLTLERGNYKPAANRMARVSEYQPHFFVQFEKLHRELFPTPYLTARQMVEKQNDYHRLLLAVEDGQLLGYHFCKIEPDSESGYIDFIGTDASARGRGIGAELLASGVDWMLTVPTTKKINLTVNADNEAARTLYEKFGFVTERIMRGYRKRVT